MTPTTHPAFDALGARWRTFLDKVTARVKEIEAEAVAGYTEVIAADAVDGTAVSGVSSALKARLLALAAKLDDAWDKIDGELDQIEVDDDHAAGRFRGQQLRFKAQFAHWLEVETERMIVAGEAEAARALHAVALREVADRVPCGQCGAPLDRPMWHQAVNVTCPHCKAITTATPGTASAMFTGGAGAIGLAREQAFAAWVAMQQAEVAWHRLRHKTLDDLARWEGANRAYWQSYAEAMGRLHPGWTAEHVANEVTGKMSWFLETEARSDRTERETNGGGIAAVVASDAGAVQAWVARHPDPDDAKQLLIVAALERGWHQHVPWIAQVLGVAADDLAEARYDFDCRGD